MHPGRAKVVLAALLVAALPASAAADRVSAVEIRTQVAEVLSDSLRAYRWFHAHPELSEKEDKTAARLSKHLTDLGMEVHEGIGGHGIVGILRSAKDSDKGPVVLYRADMDGLPVAEQTKVRYASENEGVMHACGHDVHMATAVGALRVLKALDDHWSGTVLFIGQPAEEVGKGARLMLADRKLKKILKKVGQPKVALALHDAADLPAGKVSLVSGWANANVDSVDIVVHGKGGHGARPHQAIDPIVIGAEIVMSLQTNLTRRIAADEKAVVTVGKFAGGTKHNIIPSKVTLLLTVRSYTDETRKLLLGEIEHIAVHIAKAHHAPRAPQVTVKDEYTPAAYNDPEWTKRLRKRFEKTLGANNVETHDPSLGGEDFGRYARALKIPGVQWRLGAVNPRKYRKARGKGLPGLHSDLWAPDAKPTLRTGITTAVTAILDALDE